jgi:hypothetical protein
MTNLIKDSLMTRPFCILPSKRVISRIREIILFGFLLTLNSCQKGSDKEVTSFQGFEWGAHSQAIIEKLGEPYEISSDGLTFRYDEEQLRFRFDGNIILRTEFIFEPPQRELISTATNIRSIASGSWDCSKLECSLVEGAYIFKDADESSDFELRRALERTYYSLEKHEGPPVSVWYTKNQALVTLTWGDVAQLEYKSPKRAAEIIGEPYEELEL